MNGTLETLLRTPVGRPLIALHDHWIEWNERRYNIQTGQDSTDLLDRRRLAASRYDDGLHYQAPDYANLFRILRILRPSPEDVFYDIGCGKGRVLCVFARQPLRRVVGVELVAGLCDQARQNAARMRGRRAPIEIVCGDACETDLSGGTIYFFYNPFGPSTFTEVLENIRRSNIVGPSSPAGIRIVYYNAKHESVFERSGWLERYACFRTRTGRVVAFWRSRTSV